MTTKEGARMKRRFLKYYCFFETLNFAVRQGRIAFQLQMSICLVVRSATLQAKPLEIDLEKPQVNQMVKFEQHWEQHCLLMV
jgi:hypothetical protein